jgi:hypothetical protein
MLPYCRTHLLPDASNDLLNIRATVVLRVSCGLRDLRVIVVMPIVAIDSNMLAWQRKHTQGGSRLAELEMQLLRSSTCVFRRGDNAVL